jgi:hypothetical protein
MKQAFTPRFGKPCPTQSNIGALDWKGTSSFSNRKRVSAVSRRRKDRFTGSLSFEHVTEHSVDTDFEEALCSEPDDLNEPLDVDLEGALAPVPRRCPPALNKRCTRPLNSAAILFLAKCPISTPELRNTPQNSAKSLPNAALSE